MKKFLATMIGLGLVLSTVSFAQDKMGDKPVPAKKGKKTKKDKQVKKDATAPKM